MNIKIHPGRIKYFINGTTVTAILQDCTRDLTQYYYECSDKFPYDESLYLKDNYIGVATCDSRDKFDLEIGKEIARRKAIKKYRHALVKTWNNYIIRNLKFYNKILTALCEDMMYCDDKYDKTIEKYSEDIVE